MLQKRAVVSEGKMERQVAGILAVSYLPQKIFARVLAHSAPNSGPNDLQLSNLVVDCSNRHFAVVQVRRELASAVPVTLSTVSRE